MVSEGRLDGIVDSIGIIPIITKVDVAPGPEEEVMTAGVVVREAPDSEFDLDVVCLSSPFGCST